MFSCLTNRKLIWISLFFSISIFYGKIIFNCGYNLYYLNLMLLEHKSATLPAAVLHKLPLLFLCVFFKIAKFLWLFNMTEHYIFGKLLYFFVTKMLLSLINLSIYKILFQLKKYPENFEWYFDEFQITAKFLMSDERLSWKLRA